MEKKPFGAIKKRLDEITQILADVEDAGVVGKAKALVGSLARTVERYAQKEKKDKEGPGGGGGSHR